MKERKMYGDIEIETGYEAFYFGEEIVIRGAAEIWHMPETEFKGIVRPKYDVVQVIAQLPDGSTLRVSTTLGDPRMRIISEEEK
jgi:hypothetical protein